MIITQKTIVADLKQLGLTQGDTVIVHSNLRSLGKPRDFVKLTNCGSDLIIDSFLQVVTADGLVVFPTFTSTFDQGQPGPQGQIFDPAQTSSRVGSVSDIFWRRSDAVRSTHPTHSVSAIGLSASDFCFVSDDQSTFDKRGPWGKLYDRNAYVCWFGTTSGTSTMTHAIEDWMDLPYMVDAYALVKGLDGQPKRTKVTKSPAGSRSFYQLGSRCDILLHESGIIRTGKVASATVSLIPVRPYIDLLRRAIIDAPCFLLLDEAEQDSWTEKYRQPTIDHVRDNFLF